MARIPLVLQSLLAEIGRYYRINITMLLKCGIIQFA